MTFFGPPPDGACIICYRNLAMRGDDFCLKCAATRQVYGPWEPTLVTPEKEIPSRRKFFFLSCLAFAGTALDGWAPRTKSVTFYWLFDRWAKEPWSPTLQAPRARQTVGELLRQSLPITTEKV